MDDLGRRLRDVEVELKAEKRRFETGVAAHERELAAAMADGADARGLVEDLKTSLKVPKKKKSSVLSGQTRNV